MEEAPVISVGGDLKETSVIYEMDGYDTVDVIRLDVRTAIQAGNCVTGDYSGCTLADVIGDTNNKDDFKPRIAVHFQADDFPNDGQTSNAELRQRGGSTRQAPQKSENPHT